jgi:hypothetical protein
MKIILSRKGFDSGSGGFPSPIMPDGTLLSMPIPEQGSNVRYEELFYNGMNYAEILAGLRKNENQYFGKCHLDPDIRKDIFKPNYDINRERDWKPAFGQKGSSLVHLSNKGVDVGDLFLFFGLFKQAELVDGKYRFVKGAKEKHIIWGYLQINEILVNPNSKDYPWLGRHPHLDINDPKNAIFVAKDKLSWDKQKSAAGCLNYKDSLVLTKIGLSSSRWDLPDFILETDISYHSDKHRKDGYFQSVARGQEFVFSADERPEILKWVSNLIGANPPREKKDRITPEQINQLDPDEIFVFGSNLEGNHAGGAARTAMQWGAVMGQSEGLQGKTYAIPTMFKTVEEIKPYVNRFIEYANKNPYKRFLVTKIGCGIAGFNYKDIAPLFDSVIRKNITNICLPKEWTLYLISLEGIGKD